MKMTVRGIIFFGIYIFLITLPLDTALLSNPTRIPKPFIVEIAVGAGFIGFSLLALEFALISRIEAAAQPFGEDSLQLFHNIMGGCCCAGSSPGPSDYFGFFWLSSELLAQPIC